MILLFQQFNKFITAGLRIFFQLSKLRYDKPVSEPPSPTASRCSTPHHFSDDDDSEDTDIEHTNEFGNNSQSEKSYSAFMERPKSTENVFKNMSIKD